MAGALIPLAVNVAETYGPGLIKLLAGLVHKTAPAAQAAYPASGSGPVRFTDVFTAIKAKLTAAADAGQIDKSKLPDDNTLKLMIECMVQAMDVGGLLTPAGAMLSQSAAPGPQPAPTLAQGGQHVVALGPGQSLLVTGR